MNGDEQPEINLGNELETMPDKTAEPESYPELSINNVPDENLASLPEEGTFQLKGHIIHRSSDVHPKTGKKRHSLRMRVHSIKHVHHSKVAHHHKKPVDTRMEEAGF